MKTDRDLSVLALLTTVLLWASAFVGIRAVGDTYSPGSLTLGRLVVGAAVLTLFARPTRSTLPTGRPLMLVVLYGVVWFGAYNLALNAAERDLDAGTTALIVNIGPAIAALVAGVLYKEGFPRALLIGMGVAFTGVALIAVSTDRDSTSVGTASTTGVLLCVAAAVFYACGAVAQKPALRHMAPVMSVWLGCLVGVVVCLPFAPALVSEVSGASFHDLAWLVYLGVFPTAIGFSTWSYALQRISTGQAASTTYLVPAVTTLISWVVLSEVPAALAFVGGGMCLMGVAITRIRPRTPAPADPGPVP
ncbi:DMT family transporter [Aeromicrobium fastidiosum]|uniref:DMT family transporter n=1 Tax=Aeromicrobium fastidiosum TaxID=52699 RepID=A0A641AR93_9ACTN|nr:DMT family transporter [Aeromicrobium fastidiosum]KAA1380212.1 DMT family transporter [Aeromicrobium fastidiosum]MBP2389762.1 drug/metabolite transporter (DMT)-like permease [Aeromicrobium fastidiosum]